MSIANEFVNRFEKKNICGDGIFVKLTYRDTLPRLDCSHEGPASCTLEDMGWAGNVANTNKVD